MTSPTLLISNKKKINKSPIEMVNVVLSARSSFPTIRGQCERLSNGRILATYTGDQLARCIQLFLTVKETDRKS